MSPLRLRGTRACAVPTGQALLTCWYVESSCVISGGSLSWIGYAWLFIFDTKTLQGSHFRLLYKRSVAARYLGWRMRGSVSSTQRVYKDHIFSYFISHQWRLVILDHVGVALYLQQKSKPNIVSYFIRHQWRLVIKVQICVALYLRHKAQC
jgi:hypothetical protein